MLLQETIKCPSFVYYMKSKNSANITVLPLSFNDRISSTACQLIARYSAFTDRRLVVAMTAAVPVSGDARRR